MSVNQKQDLFDILKQNEKIPAEALIDDYTLEALTALADENELQQVGLGTPPVALKTYDFHLSATRSPVPVEAADIDSATEKFLNLTLRELDITARNFKIMNL